MSALPPDIDPSRQPQRVFKAQLVVCTVLGVSAFATFCVLRYRWPHIYAVRVLRNKDIKTLPRSLLGWCWSLWSIGDEEVLEYAGLDAYVFLGFFRMAIRFFSVCCLISICLIGPIRYYYTGSFDSDGIAWSESILVRILKDADGDEDGLARAAWVYTLFTYIFTILMFYFLWNQTETVVAVRQKYLGKQDSITDRTILLEGLPTEFTVNDFNSTTNLNEVIKFDKTHLKKYIEELGIGKVREIHIAYDWDQLKALFDERKKILRNLEVAFAKYLKLDIEIYTHGNLEPSVSPTNEFNARPLIYQNWSSLLKLKKTDSISYYNRKLEIVNYKINELRRANNFKQARSAFVTMDSVASAQMAAQTVLDPHVHRLIATLAPAPHDICWENLSLTRLQKLFKTYFITIVIGITTVTLIFPVIYLSTLINLTTIEKFWPKLGEIISDSEFLTLLIGLVPPYIYTLLNVSIPYLYSFLSTKQGFVSRGEIELSTISKNFFYIFFNLFLVFTFAGTASNFWALFGDTTKIAYELANSIKTLSLFYVDLILLQGIGMFPFRLLQVGDVFLEIISRLFYCRTARDYRQLYYTPPVFDFGIQLPQHILIMIISIIYSVMSTKIVTAGLVYFILGYYTYKYQLLYTMAHPQHSTGKSWPMIFRRVCLGLILFQITMAGTLALEHAFILSILILPLIGSTILVVYNFEKDYFPLSYYIALKAIYRGESENQINEDTSVGSRLRKKRSTIDETREESKNYLCPLMTDKLSGPMVGFDGDFIQEVEMDSTSNSGINIIRKFNSVFEWE